MNRPVVIGIAAFIIIALITFLAPIELYDGVAVMASGEEIHEKMSLQYLINKEKYIEAYSGTGLVDLRLRPVGWLFIFLINFLLPVIIGYRASLGTKNTSS